MTSYDDSHLPADERFNAAPNAVPTLQHELRLVIDVDGGFPLEAGADSRAYVARFGGGRWSASWGHGTVVPGGQNVFHLKPGFGWAPDFTGLLQTDDEKPSYIIFKAQGWRIAPGDKAELFGGALDRPPNPSSPGEYFRVLFRLEAGDARFADIGTVLYIGSGRVLMPHGPAGEPKLLMDLYRVS